VIATLGLRIYLRYITGTGYNYEAEGVDSYLLGLRAGVAAAKARTKA